MSRMSFQRADVREKRSPFVSSLVLSSYNISRYHIIVTTARPLTNANSCCPIRITNCCQEDRVQDHPSASSSAVASDACRTREHRCKKCSHDDRIGRSFETRSSPRVKCISPCCRIALGPRCRRRAERIHSRHSSAMCMPNIHAERCCLHEKCADGDTYSRG